MPRRRRAPVIDRGIGAEIGNAPNVNLHYQSRVMVNADMALRWLESDNRPGNRNVSDALVRRFARLMLLGKWHLDGSPLRFTKNNELLDGQHRLWAVIQAQDFANKLSTPVRVEVPFSIVTGVSEESLIVMDTGRARKFSDFLGVMGKKHATMVAAAARWLWWYDELRRGNLTSAGGATNPEMAQACERHPTIYEWADAITSMTEAKRKIPGGVLVFVATKGAEIDRTTTETFLYGLDTGAGLDEGNPILLLRNKMERIKLGLDTSEKHSPLMRCAVTVKSWNLFRQGKTAKRLYWSPSHGESFPAFDGEG